MNMKDKKKMLEIEPSIRPCRNYGLYIIALSMRCEEGDSTNKKQPSAYHVANNGI